MYRFTTTENITSETHPDLCFATKRDHAIGYARGFGNRQVVAGVLHTATITDWDRVASWEEAVEAWAAAGLGTDPDEQPMWYADRADRRSVLTAAGFGGMIYDDAGPLNEYLHETIRVWDPSVYTVTESETLSTDDVSEAFDRLGI